MSELTERVEELEEALEEFGYHKEWFHWKYFVTEICDCGLHYAQRKDGRNAGRGTESKE